MDKPSGPAHYRRHARDYDASAQRTMVLRRRTIARLALQPGDRVLDAGCGTGLSFPWLLDAIGPGGAA
jgi:arsenite methyltransferase